VSDYLQEASEPKESPKPSDMFRRMADRMDLNEKDGFGGAFVIVPPKDGGVPLETLILDANLDPTQFWILMKTKAEDQIARLADNQRQMQGFPVRR
jgi:hypothetical protein